MLVSIDFEDGWYMVYNGNTPVDGFESFDDALMYMVHLERDNGSAV